MVSHMWLDSGEQWVLGCWIMVSHGGGVDSGEPWGVDSGEPWGGG